MNRAYLLVAVTAIGCTKRAPHASSAQLTAVQPSELARIIKQQAYQARLSIDGVAFLDSALLVGTNVGLLEVHHQQVTKLYQWFSDDNVVSGPWRDPGHNRVWIQRNHDNVFLTYGRAGWKQVEFPAPPHDYYTRGDILEGFQVLGDSQSLRLVGAGSVWRWSDADSIWVAERRPPMGESDGIVGFTMLRDRAFYVVSDGGCGYLPCVNRGFWFENGRWGKPISLGTKGRVAQVITASNDVFIRGDSGELVRVWGDSAFPLAIPGPCDAIAHTSDGKLIASFRAVGLFVFDRKWHKLFDDPAPRGAGERFAYLAEHGGTYAFATSTMPHLEVGSTDKWSQSGEIGLWISDGSRLVSVPVAHAN